MSDILQVSYKDIYNLCEINNLICFMDKTNVEKVHLTCNFPIGVFLINQFEMVSYFIEKMMRLSCVKKFSVSGIEPELHVELVAVFNHCYDRFPEFTEV